MKKLIGALLQAFGGASSAYGARTAVVVGANTSSVLPQGMHLVETDADNTVRVTHDGGTSWIALCPVSSVRYVYSDGFSTEVRGGAAGGTTQRTQVYPLA